MSSDGEIVNAQDKHILLTAATEGEFRKLVKFRASLPPVCKEQIAAIKLGTNVFIIEYSQYSPSEEIFVPYGCLSIIFDAQHTRLYYDNMHVFIPSPGLPKNIKFIACYREDQNQC